MPLDPMIARGVAPLDLSNSLVEIARMREAQARTQAYQQQNALNERKYNDGMAQQEDDDAEWERAYAAKDWGAMARIDPQAARMLWENEQASKPQAPAQLSAERVGGFEVLRDQTGKVYGQGRIKEGPSVVMGGAEQSPAGKPPQGYRWTAEGNLEPIPGGPADAKTTQPLSPKDTNTARVKLTQVQIARNQLNQAKERFAALRNSFSAGPGGGLIPTPDGKAFDAAVDSMRGSITALTRVPGVGAMSDYETRLDQAKFPKRGNYEAVAEQQLLALEELLNTIESGYSELLGTKPGAEPNTTATPEPKVQRKEAPASAVEHLRKNPQLKAAFFEKYGYLPDGIK